MRQEVLREVGLLLDSAATTTTFALDSHRRGGVP
jgi:hypothetical protein